MPSCTEHGTTGTGGSANLGKRPFQRTATLPESGTEILLPRDFAARDDWQKADAILARASAAASLVGDER